MFPCCDPIKVPSTLPFNIKYIAFRGISFVKRNETVSISDRMGPANAVL